MLGILGQSYKQPCRETIEICIQLFSDSKKKKVLSNNARFGDYRGWDIILQESCTARVTPLHDRLIAEAIKFPEKLVSYRYAARPPLA